jgi:serine/threonine-protein kinase HipA
MTIHLVGETLDKYRGHYQAGTGKLIQLTRGVYVDASDDIDTSVLTHAVRIARYLYPHAYLSGASAVLLGPTRDGRLFLSGRRKQRTRIRTLEIIQNEAPPHPSLGSAVIDDGMGEFRVDVSSIRQRFLEAFRLRSEHAASIDDVTREALAKRLIVNRLPRLTPAFSDKSTSWRADRRSDPTPSDRQRQSVCEHRAQASNPR